jgi:endonuclease YncB( thermonuclease family)
LQSLQRPSPRKARHNPLFSLDRGRDSPALVQIVVGSAATSELPSLCLAWSGKVVSVTDGDTINVIL